MTKPTHGYRSFDWSVGDYSDVFLERAERLARMRTGDKSADAETVAGLMAYYSTHPADFINDWGMTSDPRNVGTDRLVNMPFVLFDRQREYINWLHERLLAKEDGLGEKSRDMGISWLCIGFAVWMWVFHKSSVIGFGSRLQDAVDQIGNPDSLLWKARFFIDNLPIEFKPRTFSLKHHTSLMRILNPENGSSIIGGSGSNIGRGARSTIYFVDEAAHLEHAEDIDAALSQTSNCKIWVSTPCGNGNLFYRKRFSGRIPVFTFRWQDDPRKDSEWYARQCAVLDPVIRAQEIDIDYAASVSNAFISSDDISVAQRTGPADIEAIGGWIIGVDAAHEGNDSSVIHARRGRLSLPQLVASKLDGPELAALVEQRCYDIVSSNGGEIAGIVIELDGPGVSCYDQLKRGPYSYAVYGIHTGKKLKDSRHYNLRALLWARARDYILSPPVSLPQCSALRSELSAMRYSYRDGMLLMQDKKLFKRDFGHSPDHADAFVLTFYDVRPTSGPGRRAHQPRVNLSHANRKTRRR